MAIKKEGPMLKRNNGRCIHGSSKDHGCLAYIKRYEIGDSNFIPNRLLIIIGKKKLLLPNFNLFLEKIQHENESWMLFLLQRRVC